MTITLNHTVVPAADNDEAARFFAAVMGLPYTGAHPYAAHFVPIKVNERLVLDFMTAPDASGHHLAFDVDLATFEAILDRLQTQRIPYGDHPADPGNGRVDNHHPLGARGLFFRDATGNLYEVISPE
jgi:catechol 2,3-dioxygenase-like lactoylglutathione lyase family enzyme